MTTYNIVGLYVMWLVNVIYALSRHNEHVATREEITNCAQNDYNIILQY